MAEGFKTIMFKPNILKHHIPEHPKRGFVGIHSAV